MTSVVEVRGEGVEDNFSVHRQVSVSLPLQLLSFHHLTQTASRERLRRRGQGRIFTRQWTNGECWGTWHHGTERIRLRRPRAGKGITVKTDFVESRYYYTL